MEAIKNGGFTTLVVMTQNASGFVKCTYPSIKAITSVDELVTLVNSMTPTARAFILPNGDMYNLIENKSRKSFASSVEGAIKVFDDSLVANFGKEPKIKSIIESSQMNPMENQVKEKTLGEKRVRTSFNPTQASTVDQIKQKSAELIDLVETLRGDAGRPFQGEQARLIALAQTAYEEAAMWAVKAATF